jgi:hypothetical protein
MLPLHSLKTMYYSLFHCHLVYAIEIWSTVSPSALQPLINKQKAAIRIVANKRYNDHTKPIFKELSILPLTDLITTFNLKLFHSFVFGYIPSAFAETWQTVGQFHDNHDRQLRNDCEYCIPCHRTDQLARMPFFNLPKLWNLYSSDLTTSPIKHIYSKAVTTYFLHKLSATPNCTRLLCPSCLANNIENINNNTYIISLYSSSLSLSLTSSYCSCLICCFCVFFVFLGVFVVFLFFFSFLVFFLLFLSLFPLPDHQLLNQ